MFSMALYLAKNNHAWGRVFFWRSVTKILCPNIFFFFIQTPSSIIKDKNEKSIYKIKKVLINSQDIPTLFPIFFKRDSKKKYEYLLLMSPFHGYLRYVWRCTNLLTCLQNEISGSLNYFKFDHKIPFSKNVDFRNLYDTISVTNL